METIIAVGWTIGFALAGVISISTIGHAWKRRRALRVLRVNGSAKLWTDGLLLTEAFRLVGVAAFALAGALSFFHGTVKKPVLPLLGIGGLALVANTVVAKVYDRRFEQLGRRE